MMKTNHPITFDPNADYNADTLADLCNLLIGEIMEYRLEAEGYDINDSYVDYLEGSIAAREVVLGRLGVSSEFYSDGSC
jgi:hypothetical protein